MYLHLNFVRKQIRFPSLQTLLHPCLKSHLRCLKGLGSWDVHRVNIYVEAHCLWLQLPGPAVLWALFAVAGTPRSLWMLTCNNCVNSGPSNRWFFFSWRLFLLCYPHLLSRVKAEGGLTICVHSQLLRCGLYDSEALVVLLNCPIQLCFLSFCQSGVLCLVFIEYSVNLMYVEQNRQVSGLCFQIVCVWHLHLPGLADCDISWLGEEYCCFASSIKSLCSCNHGSETVRSHSDNQNKTLPTATQREARFKTASKENHKYQSVYASLLSLTIKLLCVALSCAQRLCHAVKWSVLYGHWNYPSSQGFQNSTSYRLRPSAGTQ